MKPRVEYRDNPFFCGTCDRRLAFKSVRWPMPVAHYVHADTLAYRCGEGWNRANVHSAPLALPHDLRPHARGPRGRPHDLRRRAQ